MPYVVWKKKVYRLTKQHIVKDACADRTFCGLAVPDKVFHLGPEPRFSFGVCKNCTRTAKAWVGDNVEDSE